MVRGIAALLLASALIGAQPTVAATPLLKRIVLTPGQIGAGYRMHMIAQGNIVKNQVTLDLCDLEFPSERLRKARHAKLKDLVNEALRRGLRDMNARPKRSERFRTKSVDLGRLRISGIDNIAEVLATTEGEAFK